MLLILDVLLILARDSTFLEIHAKQLVSIDFFTVPTFRFQVLYVFLVLAHDRRRILHFNVTAHPTAAATARGLSL